jgi:hypothetical protein
VAVGRGPRSWPSKNPRRFRRGSLRSSVVLALAPDPPRSSVVLPGAGNKAEKARKTKSKRAKNAEEGYVICQAQIFERDLHAATVCRHNDSHSAVIPTVEQAQCVLPCPQALPADVPASLAANVKHVASGIRRNLAATGQSRLPRPGSWCRLAPRGQSPALRFALGGRTAAALPSGERFTRRRSAERGRRSVGTLSSGGLTQRGTIHGANVGRARTMAPGARFHAAALPTKEEWARYRDGAGDSKARSRLGPGSLPRSARADDGWTPGIAQ